MSDRKCKQLGSVGGFYVKDEGIDDFDEFFNLGGFLVLDIGQVSVLKNKGLSEKFFKKVDLVFSDFNYDVFSYGVIKRDVKVGVSDYMKLVIFILEYVYRFDLLYYWKFFILVDKYNLDFLLEKFFDFWFRYVVKGLNFGNNSKGIVESIFGDLILISLYCQLICVCYVMVEVFGFLGLFVVVVGFGYVQKVYVGDVFWLIYVDWLEKEMDFKLLILKVYRYER